MTTAIIPVDEALRVLRACLLRRRTELQAGNVTELTAKATRFMAARLKLLKAHQLSYARASNDDRIAIIPTPGGFGFLVTGNLYLATDWAFYRLVDPVSMEIEMVDPESLEASETAALTR